MYVPGLVIWPLLRLSERCCIRWILKAAAQRRQRKNRKEEEAEMMMMWRGQPLLTEIRAIVDFQYKQGSKSFNQTSSYAH